MSKYFTFLFCFSFIIAQAQLANEPTSPPSDLTKGSTDLPYTFTLSFQGSGANAYLVLRSKEPVNATPLDARAYSKGEGLGNAKVFASGASTFVPIREVEAGTKYYFKVIAYNIRGNDESSINYLQSNTLDGSIISAYSNPYNYYAGIDFSSSNLLSDLSDLIVDHDIVSYDNFIQTIVQNFHERDTANGQKVINCQYSNEFKIYTPPFNFNNQNYNREHRMPFSWVNFNGDSRSDFELKPEGNDQHHLELVQADVNSQRLNYPFSSDINNSNYTYKEFKQGKDSRNNDVAEVMAGRRGDVARSIFYTMLCYNGKYNKNWGFDNLLSLAYKQDIQDLIDWHNSDPVDNFERSRNEFVASIQNNRNPFIDFPQLVDCIDFSNMSLKIDCSYVGLDKVSKPKYELSLYPNPAQKNTKVVWQSTPNSELNWRLIDLSGKVFLEGRHSPKHGNMLNLDISTLSAGYFIFVAENAEELHRATLVIQP